MEVDEVVLVGSLATSLLATCDPKAQPMHQMPEKRLDQSKQTGKKTKKAKEKKSAETASS